MSTKTKFIAVLVFILLGLGTVLYFRYYFTYEQKNVVRRKVQTVTGQNLTVTVFGFDGEIIKRWVNVKKVTSGEGSERPYTFFYTEDGRYVQIPNSVWYIAEEEE